MTVGLTVELSKTIIELRESEIASSTWEKLTVNVRVGD